MKDKLITKITNWLSKKGISKADIALLISTITLIVALLKK
jgi:predicted XRE-type DNA-binding protein